MERIFRSKALSHVPAVVLVIGIAAILCFRFLIAGVSTSGDAPDHVMYAYHFSQQFWDGDLYPRWLAQADKGYGSPIFLEQYPFPYFVTALLRPILSFAPTDTREAHELGIYCFLMFAGAGMAAYYWFRSRYSPTAAKIAAVVYMLLPYLFGVVLYDRVAIGELATFVWMPLLLGLCDRLRTQRLHTSAAIAVAFAFLLVSNILTAILFVPVLILYASVSGRRTMLSVLFALTFGTCLAAIYIVPAFSYQGLFTPKATIAHRHLAELGRNLLYVSSSELHARRIAIPITAIILLTAFVVTRHIIKSASRVSIRIGMLLALGLGLLLLIPDLGPRLITLSRLSVSGYGSFKYYSMDLLLSALLTLALGLVAYCRISHREVQRQEHVLLLIACGAFVVMLPWTSVMWKVFPRTDILQYPWRFCSIFTVAVAGLFAAGIDDSLRQGPSLPKRPSLHVLVSVATITILVGGIIWRPIPSFSTPRVDITRRMDPMYFAFVPASKIYAFAKRVGTSPDTDYVESTPVQHNVNGYFADGNGTVFIKTVTPEKLLVSANCRGDCRIQISQLYFPLWRIVPVQASSRGGETLESTAQDLMEVSLTAGQHEFWLVFDDGLPDKLGRVVSSACVLALVGWLAIVALRLRKPGVYRDAFVQGGGL
jgi:hypothetical protein